MGVNGEKCCGNDVYCRECPEWNKIIDGEEGIIGQVASVLTEGSGSKQELKSPNNSPFDDIGGNMNNRDDQEGQGVLASTLYS